MRVRPTLNAVQMEGVATASNNCGIISIKMKSVEANNTCVICVSEWRRVCHRDGGREGGACGEDRL